MNAGATQNEIAPSHSETRFAKILLCYQFRLTKTICFVPDSRERVRRFLTSESRLFCNADGAQSWGAFFEGLAQ